MSIIVRVRATAIGVALGLYVALPALSEPIDLSGVFPGAFIGDFNGDGLKDALVQPGAPGQQGGVYLGRRDGAPRSANQTLPAEFQGLPIDASRADLHLGDFDGDGRDDLYVQPFAFDGTHAIYVANDRGQLGGMADAFDGRYMGFDWSASAVVVGDFNGDGRDEIVLQGLAADAPVATITTNTRGEFEAGTQQWQDGYLGRHWNARSVRLYSGDFDGDGRSDLLLQVQDRALTRAPFRESAYALSLAQDGGFFKSIDQTWDREAFGADWDPAKFDLLLGDYNGDGITDFALMARVKGGSHALVLGGAGGRPTGVVARWRGDASPSEAYRAAQASFGAQFAAQTAGIEPVAAKPDGATAPVRRMQSFTPGTAAIGALQGQASASGGVGSYSIPIVVPPGRAGVQPQLSVSYSSRAGNGLLGMGWSLNAGSSIQRCPQSQAIPGETIIGVRLADTDRLCLDGQRLIVVSGTYGSSTAVYRTESESLVRVEQSGGAFSSNSSKFLVRHADGRISYYGQNTQSIVGSVDTPLSWLISRIEDTAGNSIIFNYDRSIAGEAPLSSITYTGRGTTAGDRAVNFVYEAREDVSTSYIAGIKHMQSRRLQKITTTVAGQLHREYRFSYKDRSDATGRSLLVSAQECATYGQLYCMPATSFTWQEPAVAFGGDNRVTIAADTQTPIDMLFVYDRSLSLIPPIYAIEPGGSFLGGGKKEVWYQAGESTVRMLRDNGSGFDDMGGSGWPMIGESFFEYMPDFRDHYYDFNNDGRLDIFAGGSISFSTTTSGTPSWSSQSITIQGGAAFAGDDWKVADFTGDGYADIVVVDGYPDRKIYLYRNDATTGLSFYARIQIADPGETTSQYGCGSPGGCVSHTDGAQLVRIIDIDGDGRPDVLFRTNDNPDTPGPVNKVLLNRYGEVDPFLVVDSPTADSQKLYLWGDVNGDGLEDIASTDVGSATSDPEFNPGWYVQLNRGGAPGNAVNFGAASYVATNANARYATRMADVDNDGRVELIVAGSRVATICMGDVDWINTDDQDYPYGAQMHGALCGGKLLKNIPSLAKFDASIYNFRAMRLNEGTGGGFTASEVVATFKAPGTGFSVGDANGDGLSDVTWAVNRSIQMYYNDDCYPMQSQCSYTFPSYGNYLNKAGQKAPDLMVAVVDGLGRTSEWTYAPLSATAAQLTTAGHALSGGQPFYEITGGNGQLDADHFHFTSTMYVVARFRSQHFGSCDQSYAPGCDTTWSTRTFGYKDAVYNNKGRGFRGFKTTIEEDRDRGLQTVRSHTVLFPFGGQDVLSETRLTANNRLVSRTTTDWTDAVKWFDANMTEVLATNGARKTVVVRPELVTTLSRDPIADTDLATTISDPTYSGVCTLSSIETVRDPVFGNGNGSNDRRQTSVVNQFNAANFGTPWLFCQPHTRTTTTTQWTAAKHTQAASTNSQTMVETFTYNGRRQITASHIEPQGSAGVLKRSTAYIYSESGAATDFGNLRSLTVSGGSGATAVAGRTTLTTWTTDGYFPYTVTDPAGLVTQFATVPQFGSPANVIGPDGLTTYFAYDAFGRQFMVESPGAPGVYTVYAAASSPTGAKYSVTRSQSGRPTSVTIFDAFNRAVRVSTQGFDGTYINADTLYDAYGRVRIKTEPYFAGGSALASTYGYDILDRMVSSMDAKGLLTTTSYTGTSVSASAVAGAITQNAKQEKDVLGLLMTAEDHDGNRTHFRYDAMNNPVRIVDAIGSVVTTAYNGLGQKTNLNDADLGQWVYTYNVLGELLTQRDARLITTTFTYDNIGRMLTRLEPETSGNCTTAWTYGAANSGVTAGRLVSVAMSGASCTSNGYREDYRYDLAGRGSSVVTTLGAGGAVAEFAMTYDAYGRLDQQWYPVKGSSSATAPNPPENLAVSPEYSTDGHVFVTWSAPVGGATPTSYKLMRSRNGGAWTTITLGASVFSYEYASMMVGEYEFKVQACIGTTCAESGTVNAVVESEGGPLSQPIEPERSALTAMDRGSRAQGGSRAPRMAKRRGDGSTVNPGIQPMVEAGRFGVKQVYNAYGYLSQVKNAQSLASYWTANALNAYGAIAQETAGNGRTTSRTFQSGTPFVSSIVTDGTSVQSLAYVWNAFGQLESRSDNLQNLTETFAYDSLNRVTSGTLSVGPTTTFSAQYDATGNITSKTDTAGTRAYTYPTPVEGVYNHPHAVTSSGGVNYGYDANGNMTSRAGSTIVFNVANLPTSITGNGYTSTFIYGPSRARYKQVAGYSGRTETTFYVGSLYERFTKTGSAVTEYRYQVTAGGLPVARVTEYSTGSPRTQYLHRDHLGSVDVMTDANGLVVSGSRMSFDTHGTRRAADSAQGLAWRALLGYSTHTALIDGMRDKTTRGFTDHEMLDNVGLIHMNGRVYDPKLGRFLSVDPLYQFPTNTQSLNPYTYVLNSPLTFTDPSGFATCGEDDPTSCLENGANIIKMKDGSEREVHVKSGSEQRDDRAEERSSRRGASVTHYGRGDTTSSERKAGQQTNGSTLGAKDRGEYAIAPRSASVKPDSIGSVAGRGSDVLMTTTSDVTGGDQPNAKERKERIEQVKTDLRENGMLSGQTVEYVDKIITVTTGEDGVKIKKEHDSWESAAQALRTSGTALLQGETTKGSTKFTLYAGALIGGKVFVNPMSYPEMSGTHTLSWRQMGMFVAMHEYAHSKLGITNETTADGLAASMMIRKGLWPATQ